MFCFLKEMGQCSGCGTIFTPSYSPIPCVNRGSPLGLYLRFEFHRNVSVFLFSSPPIFGFHFQNSPGSRYVFHLQADKAVYSFRLFLFVNGHCETINGKLKTVSIYLCHFSLCSKDVGIFQAEHSFQFWPHKFHVELWESVRSCHLDYGQRYPDH